MDTTVICRLAHGEIDESLPGIVNVFRDDDAVPWHRHDTCLAWVANHAECGFYIALAYCGGKIVGYSEWIETHDRGRNILYLSLMQVDCDMRGRGIGGAMLRDGEAYAKSIGAVSLRTLPEDELSYAFYRKYGFFETDAIESCICPTPSGAEAAPHRRPAIMARQIADTHEIVFGLCQSSSRHLYEMANHPPQTGNYQVVSSYIASGYLQFRYREGSKDALALYWSKEAATAGTVAEILQAGRLEGFDEVEFYFRTQHKDLFAGQKTSLESVEIEKKIY